MKTVWIIANWKSNLDMAQSLTWVGEVGSKLEVSENLKVVVCPSFEAVPEVKKAIQVGNFPLLVGAQDLSPFGKGAYTGEENAESLKQFIDLAILGHSERRRNFGETNEQVAEKVKRAKEEGIIPLVCISDIEVPVPEGCKLVAFEPFEAIGSGKPDTPDNANKVARILKDRYGDEMEILYGGSVTAENAKAFASQSDISGVLVGGASLKPDEFLKVVEVCGGVN